MRRFDFGRMAVCTFAVAAMLAGCGAAQPPTGASGAMAQGRAIATHAARGGSWMLPEAKAQSLLYAVGGCGGTCVVSYATGKLVGTLDEPTSEITGTCSDSAGDVFISNDQEVLEYAHGGTSPIATFQLPGKNAIGCSVDRNSGNLAVVFIGSGKDIAVFAPGQSNPTLYLSGLDSMHCGFDNAGDLYVNGFNDGNPGLSVLRNGQPSFQTLSIDRSVGNPGQVQWDGKYITYQSNSRGQATVSRLTISGSAASVVETVILKGVKRFPEPSWISGNRIIIPYTDHSFFARKLAVWKYPKGGSLLMSADFGQYKADLNLQGVALSSLPGHR